MNSIPATPMSFAARHDCQAGISACSKRGTIWNLSPGATAGQASLGCSIWQASTASCSSSATSKRLSRLSRASNSFVELLLIENESGDGTILIYDLPSSLMVIED